MRRTLRPTVSGRASAAGDPTITQTHHLRDHTHTHTHFLSQCSGKTGATFPARAGAPKVVMKIYTRELNERRSLASLQRRGEKERER